MTLAAKSPQGMKAVERQHYVEKCIEKAVPNHVMVSTPFGASRIDAMLIDSGDVLSGLFEIKSRTLSMSQLRTYETLLITNNKIKAGVELSKQLQCPFYVAAITSDDHIVIWKITNQNGKKIISFTVETTETQRTIADKTRTKRANAYLKVTDSCIILDPSKEMIWSER